MDGWRVCGCVDGCVDGWIDERMDGWMDGRTGGWMDERKGDLFFFSCFVFYKSLLEGRYLQFN